MEITRVLAGLGAYRQNTGDRNNEVRKEKQSERSGGDRISLSSEAKKKASSLNAESTVDEERQAKVEAIKARVANGTYEVDSKFVAEKLIKKEPNLFTY